MSKPIKSFHTETIRKTIKVRATKEKVWRKISNVAGLPSWASQVRKTFYISKKRRGVGTIRSIEFEDGSTVEEHIVAWKDGEYFTYIATDGLPLRAYVATISIRPYKKKVQLVWQSYLSSKKMSDKEFKKFVSYLGSFYQDSLKNIKTILER